uniref:Uncharacterized protein n=1 Tax=Ciona intestinalis TaxID=7719 RepID=H2XZ42_CIOIN
KKSINKTLFLNFLRNGYTTRIQHVLVVFLYHQIHIYIVGIPSVSVVISRHLPAPTAGARTVSLLLLEPPSQVPHASQSMMQSIQSASSKI